GVSVDVNGMVDEALRRGNSGFFVLNAAENLIGIERHVSVATRIDYDRTAVNNFIAGVRRAYDRPAKDAAVTYSARSLGQTDGQIGIKVRSARLRREIVATFNDPDAPRRIKLPVRIKRPKVTRGELAGKYPTIILIDRGGFKLRLFKKLKLVKTYGIAVGQVGLETPAGLYTINDKQINPAWHVPNSAWAGDLAGKVIPGGAPNNPLVARWLGVYDGVGIHGTSSTGSIGSAASHGCIRMVPSQVIDLYDRVPIGTPVYIG
ncbi:MAG: L,D-transpeptidase/peptidoglycan binding protein, partial [Thermoleophilia bacterium]|nr:L,D-transpeptidase/peptidoglycan binding protein [Thermoleophilia bacterium]